MTATYTFDVLCTLDGYGSYGSGGDWGGYWGKHGPEFLDRRLALHEGDLRMVLGANTFRQFLELLGPDSGVDDPVNNRIKSLPTTVVSTTLEGPLDWPDLTLVSGDAVDVVTRLKEESAVPLRSHGSLSMNRALMAAGLVDRVLIRRTTGRLNGARRIAWARTSGTTAGARASRSATTGATDVRSSARSARSPELQRLALEVDARGADARRPSQPPGAMGIRRRALLRRTSASRSAACATCARECSRAESASTGSRSSRPTRSSVSRPRRSTGCPRRCSRCTEVDKVKPPSVDGHGVLVSEIQDRADFAAAIPSSSASGRSPGGGPATLAPSRVGELAREPAPGGGREGVAPREEGADRRRAPAA